MKVRADWRAGTEREEDGGSRVRVRARVWMGVGVGVGDVEGDVGGKGINECLRG